MVERRVKKSYREALYLGIPTGNDCRGDTELATSLGVGYHMDGLPMGCAPEETKYWFEGALICLTPQLNYPGILEQAVADAVEYGRANCTRESFNAILISIEHLVLIKSFQDGQRDHTEVLPLLDITAHLSKDAQARYGDEALKSAYDALAKSQQSSETHDEDCEDNRMIEPYENEMEVVRETPVPEATIKNSFMALVQFFDATTRETLRPAQANEARLPEEICEMVLRNVSDIEVYNSCLKVS